MKHAILLLAISLPIAATTVNPTTLVLRTVSDAGAPPKPTIRIETAGPWTLQIPTALNAFLRVDPTWAVSATGTGPSTVRFVVTSVPPPGVKTGVVTLTASNVVIPIPVSYTVVAAYAQPRFSSAFSPVSARDCTSQPGFIGPAAKCTTPGVSPAGFSQTESAWQDHNFGGYARVITDFPSVHGYATPSAISARNKYIIAGKLDGFYAQFYSLGSLQRTYENRAMAFQGVWWDAYDDEVSYHLKGAKIMSFSMHSKQWTTIADFTGRFTTITSGGTGDTSKDNWVSFFAPIEKTVCAFNITARRNYCHNYGTLGDGGSNLLTALPVKTVDFVMISKGVDSASRKRYVVVAAEPAMAVYAVDEENERLVLTSRGPERLDIITGNRDGLCQVGETCFSSRHGDVFESSDGQQWFMTVFDTAMPASRMLVSLRLNASNLGVREELKGGMRKIMTLFPSGAQWLDHHIGCAKNAPTCVVSMQTNIPVQAGSAVTIPPYGGQLFTVRDNTEVRQLGYHKSVQIIGEVALSYWSRARACLSNDGRYVVFSSNFGRPNDQRVVVLDAGVTQ